MDHTLDSKTIDAQPFIWQASLGEKRLKVTLTMLCTKAGIHGILTGGELPHVGGVVLALPRRSLAHADQWSADLFIAPVPGHKDTDVAGRVASLLAKELKQPVVVSAGIHSDCLNAEEIQAIAFTCEQLGHRFLQWVEQNKQNKPEWR